MNRNEFFISVGVIFYLFVSLNYPILDILVNPVKAAAREACLVGATSNSTLESQDNLKSQDLLLSYTIETHKWNVHSLKSIQKPKPLPEVLPPSPIDSKPSIKISTPNKPQRSGTPLTNKKPPSTIHVVKPGDTLWKISARYGVNGSTICKLNELKGSDMLSVGMKLQVLGCSRL
ncbi:MAG: LysM peptidoglycan-binding domain-containing protein [Nitrospirota bacterium]